MEYDQWSCIKCAHIDGREAVYVITEAGQSEFSVKTNPSVTKLLKLKHYPDVGPTYNYSPNDSKGISWYDSLGSIIIGIAHAKTSHNSIAHYYFDMLPYYWWGNTPEGYGHVHKFGEWVVTKEATETSCGEETRTCSKCGEMETKEIPMLNHTHAYTTTTQAATCTTTGLMTQTCACGDVITVTLEIIPHNYVNGTCTMCGESEEMTPTYCGTPQILTTNYKEVRLGNNMVLSWLAPNTPEKGVTYYIAIMKAGNETETYTEVTPDWISSTNYRIDESYLSEVGTYIITVYAKANGYSQSSASINIVVVDPVISIDLVPLILLVKDYEELLELIGNVYGDDSFDLKKFNAYYNYISLVYLTLL